MNDIDEYYAVVKEINPPMDNVTFWSTGTCVAPVDSSRWVMPDGFTWGVVYNILSVDVDCICLIDDNHDLKALKHPEIRLLPRTVWGLGGWVTHSDNEDWHTNEYGQPDMPPWFWKCPKCGQATAWSCIKGCNDCSEKNEK